MEPITTGALIAGAAQMGGSLFNYYGQKDTNAQARQHTIEMYERQRRDNLEMWQRQNAYNSPQGQMQRLHDAGLNPHLVYGKGADATAGPIQSATPQSWNPTAPNLDVAGPINTYFDVQIKKAQTDNLGAQTANAMTDGLLKLEELTSKKRDNKFAEQLFNTQAEIVTETLRQQKINNQSSIDANKRANDMHGLNLQNAIEQQLNSKSHRQLQDSQRQLITKQMQSTEVQTALSQLDFKLRQQGINPNGPLYERIAGGFINEITNGRPIFEVVTEFLKGKWNEYTQ